MRQAIIWTNADPFHWRRYAALGWDELKCRPDWRNVSRIKLYHKSGGCLDILCVKAVSSVVVKYLKLYNISYSMYYWLNHCPKSVMSTQSVQCRPNTVPYRYNAVNILHIIRNRYHIVRPRGRDMECLCVFKAWPMFYVALHCCIQYRVILSRVITAPACNMWAWL